MKRSIIWTTAGIAAIGFAVPAFAAANSNSTKPAVPASVTVTNNTVKNSGTDSARDIIEATTVAAANVTPTSVDDNATRNSVDDDATPNSVEDISGNCDEAEHANDAACTGAAATSNTVDDNSGHNGNDDSGHGSDDSGHGGNDD